MPKISHYRCHDRAACGCLGHLSDDPEEVTCRSCQRTILWQHHSKGVTDYNDRVNFLGQLRWMGLVLGYSPGWANNKYRTRFGNWPAQEMANVPLRPVSDNVFGDAVKGIIDFWRKANGF